MEVRSITPTESKTNNPLDPGRYEVQVIEIVRDPVNGGCGLTDHGSCYHDTITLNKGDVIYVKPAEKPEVCWSVWLKHESQSEYYISYFMYEDGGCISSKAVLGSPRLNLIDLKYISRKDDAKKRTLKMGFRNK